jgi:hypothetical protein
MHKRNFRSIVLFSTGIYALLKTYFNSYQSDLNTLAQIPIHNSIVPDARKLDDYVPKEKLYAWVNRCQTAHGTQKLHNILDHLVLKVSQLMESMQEIKAGSDAEKLQATGIE